MANKGDRVDIDLAQSIEVQEVNRSVRPFGTPSPHIKNTGIERNGGLTNIYEQETAYVGAGYRFITESGRVLSAEDVGGTNYKVIKVDGLAIGQVSKYGVESKTEFSGYDDTALSADGTVMAIKIAQTTVTIYELSLLGVQLNTRSVTFTGLSALSAYFSSLSLVRYINMHYVDSQEFALRMGDNVILLKESTPSQIIPYAIGGNGSVLFPGSADTIVSVTTYSRYLVFGSSGGRIASFDGINFRLSDGSGIGTGPWNNATAIGTNSVDCMCEYAPNTTLWSLVIAGGVRVASWDGIAWKNYDGTGTGSGAFNNSTATGAQNITAMAYVFGAYVAIGTASGRVATYSVNGWKNYDGTGTGSGPSDNATVIGAVTIRAIAYTTIGTPRITVAGDSGRVGSWNGTTWNIYTSGVGPANNGTAIGANNIYSIYNNIGSNSGIVIGGVGGRVASWDGGVWRNYDGTGSGNGPRSNGTVVGASIVKAIVGMPANGVAPNDNNVVFIGDNAGARIGSWDGQNYKNYDGTGTGLGTFTQNVPYLAGATYGVVYSINSQTVLVFGSTIYNYITQTSTLGTIYQNGTAYQASILYSVDLSGYLYVYRYEDGRYLMNVTGNSTNKLFIVSTTVATPVITQNFGRWALPQVGSSKTRHIIIETPRISGAVIKALSLLGYVDFVSFVSATQTYPANDTANVNAINISSIGPVVGFNYTDVTFRTTASATDINLLYTPIPLSAPAAFNQIRQQNTATNINGYGKLNNMLGQLSAKPFEFRNIFTSGIQSTLSVAMLDGLQIDALGVLITNLGEWDNTYTPMIVDDDKILYKANGKFVVVKIGTSISNFFSKVSSDLYKLNTIHPSSLYSDSDKTLYQSSIDYHGQGFFAATAAPATTDTQVASIVENQFSNGIDVGVKLVQIASFTSANFEVFGGRLPSQYGVQPPYAVDTYVNGDYAFSTLSDGTEQISPDKADLVYVENTNIPISIGGSYYLSTVVIGGTTVFLITDKDVYQIGNDTPGSFIGFQLYGTNYIFDGRFVYQLTEMSNVFVSKSIIAPADGLVYIASSPNQIYFLSDFDNSIYTFNGGRSLDKSMRLTNTDSVIKGVWSVHDNTLALETTNTFLYVRDNIITQNDKKTTQTALKLYETVVGVVISNDSYKWRYTYAQLSGSTVVPLTIKTAFYGLGTDQGSILKSVVVTLYSATKSKLTGLYQIDTYDQDEAYTELGVVSVQPSDYNSQGFARFRVNPKYPRSLGASYQITINEKILVDNIVPLFGPTVGAVVKKGMTR